ncbi:MAG: outer membrane lipoprotein-sorting protein [Candidatus Omnitrophota bacterium]
MKRVLLLLAVIFAAGLIPSAPARSADMDVQTIVEKANVTAYYQGDDGLSDARMTITDSQGRERIREFRIMRLDISDGGKQKYYVYFRKPPDVAEMVYMVWKQLGQDDDRWLYLPGLDLVRRIAASDKRSSFVGSHFVYEDVSGRSLDLDTHTLESETDSRYVIKNVPKDKANVEFAHYLVSIDKETFLPMKAEYFDESGEKYREMEVLEMDTIDGYPTATKSVIRNLADGGRTVMDFSNIKYDVGLDESIFSERYLRRPPTQWIR